MLKFFAIWFVMVATLLQMQAVPWYSFDSIAHGEDQHSGLTIQKPVTGKHECCTSTQEAGTSSSLPDQNQNSRNCCDGAMGCINACCRLAPIVFMISMELNHVLPVRNSIDFLQFSQTILPYPFINKATHPPDLCFFGSASSNLSDISC